MIRAAAALVLSAFVAASAPYPVLAQTENERPSREAAPADGPAADLILEAGRLLAAGHAEEAWGMLQAREPEFVGDPDFDYALGLAAVDSGRPGQAIFAFERVLLTRPDFLPARAEIARAYFMNREQENARREFNIVSGQEIPEAARRTIGRYIDAIQQASEAAQPRIEWRTEFETGYDSNVNFGSASGQWVLADGTAVTPLAASRPRTSSVLGAAISLNASGPVTDDLEWVVGGRAALRSYPSVQEFNQQQFDLSGGLTLRRGCHRYTALALVQHLRLDGDAYRNAAGGALQWQCEVNPRTLIGASLQSFELDFPGAGLRNAQRNTVGLNAARLLEGAGQPILLGSLAIGKEASKRGMDVLSHDFVTLRAGIVAQIAPQWRASANVSWERRQFGAAEPIFGVVREDRQTELRIEFERNIDNRTAVVPQIVHTRNRSTLSPNDFRRTQIGVQLRHRF